MVEQMFALLKKKTVIHNADMTPRVSVRTTNEDPPSRGSEEDAPTDHAGEMPQPQQPELSLPTSVGGLPLPVIGEVEGEDVKDDHNWSREVTKDKEERIAAQVKRRRGLQEEEFSESSMPVRRPVRAACQSCRHDIQINDNRHRIVCDSRDKHSFCKQCITSHVEAWINGEEECELRQVRYGTVRGIYALPCMSSECKFGCLQEVQLRALLDSSVYSKFRQRLIRARSERPTSKVAGDRPAAHTQPPSLTPFEHRDAQPQSLVAENPRQFALKQDVSDPRILVRQWKLQRQRELEHQSDQIYQSLSVLEQSFMRSRHQLFQQQLGSFRSLSELSSNEEPRSSFRSLPEVNSREDEVPPEPVAPQRATTATTTNISQNRLRQQQMQRSSAQSLPPTGSEILSLFMQETPASSEPETAPLAKSASEHEGLPLNNESEPGTLSEVQQPLHLRDPVHDIEPLPSRLPTLPDPSSSVMTCQCCYEEFTSADATTPRLHCQPLVATSESHSFCGKCVRSYIEEWLFGTATLTLRPGKDDKGEPTSAFPCLFGDCSEGGLPDREVKKALSATSMEKYLEKMSALRSREEDDEERLLKVAIRLSLQQQEMQKRVEQMQREQLELSFSDLPKKMVSVGTPASEAADTSASTLPISSPNVSNSEQRSSSTDQKQESYEKSLHLVEEAMSEAKFRTCPKCTKKFLKDEDFCNKLKCPSCGTAICYICRQELPPKGYDHFCIHKRGGCEACVGNHCPLWTDVDQDNERDQAEMRERGLDAANRVWEESLLEETQGGPHEEIRVDVDKLLQQPPPSKDE